MSVKGPIVQMYDRQFDNVESFNDYLARIERQLEKHSHETKGAFVTKEKMKGFQYFAEDDSEEEAVQPCSLTQAQLEAFHKQKIAFEKDMTEQSKSPLAQLNRRR